jgi:hypothetical protein
MPRFVDLGKGPSKSEAPPHPWTTAEPGDLAELHRLCRESRIYDVERWIAAGNPLSARRRIGFEGANDLRFT